VTSLSTLLFVALQVTGSAGNFPDRAVRELA